MSDKHNIGLDLFSLSDNGLRKPVSRITLYVNNEDDQVYTAGDDTGLELTATCIYATQEMANTLLSMAKGAQYRMYEAQAANLDPAAELGDGVLVGGIDSIIAQISDNGDGYPDISASGEKEVEDEYPGAGGKGPIQRELARARSLISKTNERISFEIYGEDGKGGLSGKMTTFILSLSGISSRVQETENKFSTISQNVDKIAMEVHGNDGTGGLAGQYSSLALSVGSIEGRVDGVEGEFAAFVLDTDAFYVLDASGNRAAIRGSSIDVSTLNVQNINFSGAISFGDLTGTDNLLANVDTALGYADEALGIAQNVGTDLQSLANGTYYDGTFIDGTRVIAPEIYAGMFYATGEGRNNQAAYYIYDSYDQKNDTLGNKVGFLSYDTSGTGTAEEATKRVMLTTLNGTALKLQSDGNMSLAANRIYMMSDTQFSGIVILESACCGSPLPDESDAINGQLFFLFE